MYSGNRRLDYTRIYHGGARTRQASGTGKQAGRGLSSKKPVRSTPLRTQNSFLRELEEEKKRHKKGAEEVIQAILLWLNESLPPMLKRAINFDTNVQTTTYANPKVSISTNVDYTGGRRAYGEIEFTEDKVLVSCSESRWSSSQWRVGVDYADPELFEKIQLLLSKFYNGQTA